MLDNVEHAAATPARSRSNSRSSSSASTRKCRNAGTRSLCFGIALATGPMTCGLFGFSDFQSYGAVGEVARLQPPPLLHQSRLWQSRPARRPHLRTHEGHTSKPVPWKWSMHRTCTRSPKSMNSSRKRMRSHERSKCPRRLLAGRRRLAQGRLQIHARNFQQARIEGRDDPPLRYFTERAETSAAKDPAAGEFQGSARHVRLLTGN